MASNIVDMIHFPDHAGYPKSQEWQRAYERLNSGWFSINGRGVSSVYKSSPVNLKPGYRQIAHLAEKQRDCRFLPPLEPVRENVSHFLREFGMELLGIEIQQSRERERGIRKLW